MYQGAAQTTEAFATLPQRMQWIIELMSRYAQQRSNDHESARLSAAIVSHLKTIARDAIVGSQFADTVSHWLETWEPIMEWNLMRQQAMADANQSLRSLISRARFA
jgi:hypothetical protein